MVARINTRSIEPNTILPEDVADGSLTEAKLAFPPAKTNTSNIWTAIQVPDNNTGTISTTSTYSFDGSDQIRSLTLTNEITVTFDAPTGIAPLAVYKFILTAGDTSARTFVWNTAFKFPGASSQIGSGTQTNGASDIITFVGGPANTLLFDGVVKDVR